MNFRHFLVIAALGMLSACASDSAPKLGSDRDVHGCIASAGYSWCTRTSRCERPVERAQYQGFAPTKEAFDQNCGNPG